MQLNAEKCKVMGIYFKGHKYHFIPLMVDGKELETVDKAKILGVTISCNLKWNNHVNESIKKANKRLFFLVPLRRARVPTEDIVNFFCTTIRPVLEYSAQIFHLALPAYLSDDMKRVQRRALFIVYPELRRVKLCDNLFLTMSNPCHSFSCLPPERHHAAYNTGRQRVFNMPRLRTNRFKRSFIPAMCARANLGLKLR